MLLIAGGVHVVSMLWHVLGFQVLLIAFLTWHVLYGSLPPVTIGLLPLWALHQMCQDCQLGGVCNMNYKVPSGELQKYDWFSRVSKCALRESFNGLNS